MRRRNLEVVTEAHATKIEIVDGRATGVTVRRGGAEKTHLARAIVVSAGAYASPQLLMLSGIGPAASLQEHGIPMQVDAPEVGENLQDHPILPMVMPSVPRGHPNAVVAMIANRAATWIDQAIAS